MKKIVVVLVSLVVAVLIGVGNAFAQDETSEAPPSLPAPLEPPIPEPSLDPEWKLVAKDSDGTTVYVNTKNITYLQEDIVKVWVLWVPRGKERVKMVDVLRERFRAQGSGWNAAFGLKGNDPNDAERLWYTIILEKLNCKTNQFAVLEVFNYSFEGRVLAHLSVQHEKSKNVENIVNNIVKSLLTHRSFQYEDWKDIPPGGPDEKIAQFVCKSTRGEK